MMFFYHSSQVIRSNKAIYLSFEGVKSAFDVWINGIPLGYCQDSMTRHTWRIDNKLSQFSLINSREDNSNSNTNTNNNNASAVSVTIALRVLRWCDGTYMVGIRSSIQILLLRVMLNGHLSQ